MAIPHTTGGEATGEAFYEGRRPYVNELGSKIDDSKDNLILILGPRRIGKTSIVKQFFEERNENTDDPGVYIYIPKIENLVDFYKKSIEEIQKSLKENGKHKKFQDLIRGSRVKEAIGAVQEKIEKISVAGYGVTVKDTDKWKEYTSLVATLKEEFISLILAFEKKKVVLGFDEVPEAIQHLLKNATGQDEVELWLEHFREIRHSTGLKDIVNLILFGSVNMKLTLEKIGQTKGVNDAFNITIKLLSPKEVKELFWDLVDTLKFKILEDNKDLVDPFLDKMFAHSSPWAIQNFLDKFESPSTKEKINDALKLAYMELFDVIGGVRSVAERLGIYHKPDDVKAIKAILKFIVQKHLDDKIEVISDKTLFAWTKKELKVDRERHHELVDILLLDNMANREAGGYSIKNTVERYFWYERLVGSCNI